MEQELDYLEVNLQHQLVVCLDNNLSSRQLLALVFSDKHLRPLSNQLVGVFLGKQHLNSQRRVDYSEIKLSSNLEEDFSALSNNHPQAVCLGKSLKQWEDCLVSSQLSLLLAFLMPKLSSPLEEDYLDSNLRPVSFLSSSLSSRWAFNSSNNRTQLLPLPTSICTAPKTHSESLTRSFRRTTPC